MLSGFKAKGVTEARWHQAGCQRTAPESFVIEDPQVDYEDARTYQEEFEASATTLRARRWVSDVLAVLPSVMAYLREEYGGRLAQLYGAEEAERIWREAEEGYRTLVDAARRADASKSRVRRFPLASWLAEAHRGGSPRH